MNHLIVVYNVFGLESASRLLFFKLEEKDYKVIKPFLLFLGLLPAWVMGIRGRDVFTDNIGLDEGAVTCLRQLSKF